jgi:hypothetical protein
VQTVLLAGRLSATIRRRGFAHFTDSPCDLAAATSALPSLTGLRVGVADNETPELPLVRDVRPRLETDTPTDPALTPRRSFPIRLAPFFRRLRPRHSLVTIPAENVQLTTDAYKGYPAREGLQQAQIGRPGLVWPVVVRHGSSDSHFRKTGRDENQHLVRRTREPDDADALPTPDPFDERL